MFCIQTVLEKAVVKPSFQKMGGGQPVWLRVVTTPKCIKSAYWEHKEKKEFGLQAYNNKRKGQRSLFVFHFKVDGSVFLLST